MWITTTNIKALSRNPSLTQADLLAYPHLPWKQGDFGPCTQIPLRWLCQQQLHQKIDIPWYVRRPDLTLELALAHPHWWKLTLQHGQ